MKLKTVLGTTFIVAGISLIGLSLYIDSELEEGKKQASKAQSSVDLGNKLFSLTPTTKEVGPFLSRPFQKKIDQGLATIADYEKIQKNCEIGGIVAIFIGISIFIMAYRKHS